MKKFKFETKEERNELLANEIISFLKKKDYTDDVIVYWNGKRVFLEESKTEEVNVQDYLEFCNPDGVSMTYEGYLYNLINYDEYRLGSKLLEQLDKIAAKYGMYHEFGYAWSMSFYEL